MYVKLFSSILTSSVWSEDMPTRLTWVALLAMADADGFVRGSDDGLARLANIPLPDFQRALHILESPDARRPGQEHDGRRIERNVEGVTILNYGRYRELRDVDVRREQTRDRVRKHRERKRLGDVTPDVTPDNAKQKQKQRQNTAHAARFSGTVLESYLALREAARVPEAFDAGLAVIVEPPLGGVRYSWDVVGRALVDLHVTGTKPSPAAIRSFCRRILNDDANPGGEKRGASKQERGRAALADFMRRHDGEHGDGGAVPGVVPRALPHPRRDGADGGGVDGCAA